MKYATFSFENMLKFSTTVILDRSISQLDVHMAGKHIYWVEYSTSNSPDGVYRVKSDGSGLEQVIYSDGLGTGEIKGIAVDWVAGLFCKKLVYFLRLKCFFFIIK